MHKTTPDSSTKWRDTGRPLQHFFRGEFTGKYSIERLRALREYQETTSWWRILLVLLFTPVPAVLLVLFTSFLPLQDPHQGLRANWHFLLRAWICFLLDDFVGQRQLAFVTQTRLLISQGLGQALIRSSIMTITLVVLSLASGQFPMPFGYLLVYVISILLHVIVTKSLPRRDASSSMPQPRAKTAVVYVQSHEDKKSDHSNSSSREDPPHCLPHEHSSANDGPIDTRIANLPSSLSSKVIRTDPMPAPINPKDQWITEKEEVMTESERQQSFRKVLWFQRSFMFIYTAFTIGYHKLDCHPHLWQVAYVCLLPVVKKFLTLVDRHHLQRLEDIAPETIAFSVKFFSSSYLAMCLGSSRTWLVSVILMIEDSIHLVTAVWLAKRQCNEYFTCVKRLSYEEKAAMISWCLNIADRNTNLIRSAIHAIRLSASNNLMFRKARLPSMTSFHSVNSSMTESTGEPPNSFLSKQHQTTVSLSPQGPSRRSESASTPSRRRSREYNEELSQQIHLVKDTLCLMYILEYITLAEYIEAFTPFFYVLHVHLAFNGPNRLFFYGIRDLKSSQEMLEVTQVVIWYGLLEPASLLVICGYVRVRLGVNMLSVLAFVLETHWISIQSKMVMFVCQILNLMLIHNGEFIRTNHASRMVRSMTETDVGLVEGVNFKLKS